LPLTVGILFEVLGPWVFDATALAGIAEDMVRLIAVTGTELADTRAFIGAR
jgi:hypothetical protein